jgi:F-type H+-transporting ATPase subunit b
MTSLILLAGVAGTLLAQVATVVLAFFIVMAILYAVAWKPVLSLLDERRNTVVNEFAQIERRQSELESKVRDYEERLRQIDSVARQRLNEAVDEGRKTALQLVEEARQASEELKAKASADIRIEMDKARVELRDRIVSLTVAASGKLMQAELNEARQRALVESFLTELEGRQSA